MVTEGKKFKVDREKKKDLLSVM